MKIKSRALALVAMVGAATTFGCNNFLTGDKLSNNPNLPTTATADQLFIGVQNWLRRRRGSLPAHPIARVEEISVGGARPWC